MLDNLIYFRRLLISNRTGHLTKEQVIERVKYCDDIANFVKAYTQDDPDIFLTVEDNINCKCEHSWVEDLVDCGLEDIQTVKYCEICELDFFKWKDN